jgi:lipopolysaccharide transport system permease protein
MLSKNNAEFKPSHFKPHLIIKPSSGWGNLGFKEIWEYRDLAWTLIARDLKTRYRQQALGPLWLLISPFFGMVVSSFIFGTIAGLPSDGVPYPIFLYTGALTWGFFSTIYTGSLSSITGYVGWMSRIYFPRLLAPIIQVVIGLVDWFIQISILLLLMLYYQIPIKVTILLVPLFLVIALVAGASIGLWASAISVKFRDFPSLMGYGITAWYYVTPVLYSASLVPSKWAWLYKLNPMYWAVEGVRWAILGIGRPPEIFMIIPIIIFCILFVLSVMIFLRTSRNVVDIQ